ncbi:MAG TPA: NAD(P)/FAD-dependent oxidoreductase [Solirubrobacteraceae bacterium]|nr:NAD(P)/FAD-dependent oxidoreductase [Solirubrobacteraceae bacterium]
MPASNEGRHRVVVVGGGFGGLQAAMKVSRGPVDVTLVDRRNFHLFQPLAYQVATGALSPGEICYPLRVIFRKRDNVRVVMAEVTGFDLTARSVEVEPVGTHGELSLPYDTLIVAGGSNYSYFGHDDWRTAAPELKSLEGALELRRRILLAFEAAEVEPDPDRRAAWLTFVGGGPTGVEMAGQIGEIARDSRREFRAFDSRRARILLVETADRLLTTFPPSLSAKAARSLERLGVTPRLGETAMAIDAQAVTIRDQKGDVEHVPARTTVWAAGVTASSLAGRLGELTGAETDRAGRVTVEPDLSLPGHPEVIALGDMVRIRREDDEPLELPGLAPVAMQEGRYAGRLVRNRLRGRETAPFHYRDKGNLATIGRASAVADLNFVRLSGFIAWVGWLVVHLWYLIGFQNRLLVLIRWSFSFFTHGRGARLITGEEGSAGS